MQKELKRKAEDKMKAAIEALKKDFAAIRTGRASLALLDHIIVDMYGTPSHLNQAATLNIPESRTITIQPWDPKLIPAIEKAIMKSDLGLTPMNDGKLIRINIPALTEERRKDIVKHVKKRAEESKVSVRNIRRELNDSLKKLEKEKSITEDDLKSGLDEMQKITDDSIKKIDEVCAHKEKEVMEV